MIIGEGLDKVFSNPCKRHQVPNCSVGEAHGACIYLTSFQSLLSQDREFLTMLYMIDPPLYPPLIYKLRGYPPSISHFFRHWLQIVEPSVQADKHFVRRYFNICPVLRIMNVILLQSSKSICANM